MNQSNDNKQKDLEGRIAKAKTDSYNEAANKLDEEISERARNIISLRKSREEQDFKNLLQNAEVRKETEKNKIKSGANEYFDKLSKELRSKIELRIKREEEERRKAEEEERRLQALRRQQLEEETRLENERINKERAEEARLRREEELRIQDENRKRKEAEEQNRIEEENQRLALISKQKEDEKRIKDAEKSSRIRALLASANEYLSSGDSDLALVEVAKALVNDPTNPEALELEKKIRGARPQPVQADAGTTEGKQKSKTPSLKKSETPSPLIKKRISFKYVAGIIGLIAVVVILITLQMKKYVFNLPVKVAVMPWISQSNTLESNIIGTSLAWEVSDKFASYSGKPVLNYSSTYRLFQRTSLPEREIYQQGYTFLLTGDVEKTGTSFMLKLRLTDSLGNEVWSSKLPSVQSDLVLLPAEVVKQLADVLKIKIPDDHSARKLNVTSKNPDSYIFYLRCREMLNRKTPESLKNAYDLILQGIQEDPKFAEGLALASDILSSMYDKELITGDSVIDRAKNLASAAIGSNPTLDKGYIALGKTYAFEKNYSKALICYDSALSLCANNSDAMFEKAKVLFKTGKIQEAFELFSQVFRLDGCNPEILETYGEAHQLTGRYPAGMVYHELGTRYTLDSLSYLAGPVSDAILADPELRLAQSQRVLTACAKRMMVNQDDYHTLYSYSRLKQVMGHLDSDTQLKKLRNLLTELIRKSPNDAMPVAYLALAETRLGRFPEAVSIAERAMSIEPKNARVKYKVAQMYALQMYSQKEKRYDEKKKNESARYLREAISLNYKFDELVNADFFNMFEKQDFKSALQERSR